MADNTQLNAGTGGDTIASDDIGGVKHQRVKHSVGADGSASDAIPVSNGLDTTAAGVPAVGLVAQLDDTAPSTVTENQFGPVRMSTRRALLVEGVASGTAQPVSGTVTAEQGTAASLNCTEASAAAIKTAVEIMDDWDETDRAKVNLIAGQAGITGGAGAVGASTPRVTLASDDPAVASLSVLDDWDETDRAKVNVIAGQAGITAGAGNVAANTPRVTLAADDPAVASLSVLDDWDNAASDGCSVSGDVAHDAVDAGEPVKLGGRADTTFQAAVADGDRVAALFDVYGVQAVRSDHPNKWSYHENSSSALTDATVQAAPGAGLSVYITDLMISIGAATALNVFLEEGATTILGPYYLEAVNGRSLHVRLKTPKKATANTAVTVTTSAAIAHGIDILGFIAP